jgi:hypothetical protein
MRKTKNTVAMFAPAERRPAKVQANFAREAMGMVVATCGRLFVVSPETSRS